MAVHAPQRHDSEEVSCDEAGTDDQTIPALLDMAYIGNWILNSTRGDDRFKDYDDVESLLFAKPGGGHGRAGRGLAGRGGASRAFAEGGIHEAIMEYENNVFFDILAEDLARRDMEDAPSTRTTMRSCPAALTPILPSSSSTALTTFWWTATSYRPDTQGGEPHTRFAAPFCSVHVSWSIQIGNSTPYTVSRESRPASMVPPGPSRTVTVQTVSDRYSASASFSRKRASASSAQAAS
mgnify:CR=1 FL=1